MTVGWFYLYPTGEFHYKPVFKEEVDGEANHARMRELAVAVWPFDPADRTSVWNALVEGLAGGADPERIKEFAKVWHCDDEDAKAYAEKVGVTLSRDGDMWCSTRRDFVDLAVSPAGFGPTCLEAMAALAKELGYKSTKADRPRFVDLLKIT